MHPVVFHSRVDSPGGLWTPKLAGFVQEGDPGNTSFAIEGRVEVKELGGKNLRLFFQGE